MSLFDYRVSQDLNRYDYPFYALIMAAMHKADTQNFALLAAAYPAIALEMRNRYNAPGGFLVGEKK